MPTLFRAQTFKKIYYITNRISFFENSRLSERTNSFVPRPNFRNFFLKYRTTRDLIRNIIACLCALLKCLKEHVYDIPDPPRNKENFKRHKYLQI